MKPGEIWSFETPSKATYWCRVVASVVKLRLPADNPMSFVASSILVQVCLPQAVTQAAIPREDILVNGMFLLAPPRRVKKAGFQRIAAGEVALEDIEFPCWLIEDSARGVLFCRGELIDPIRRPNALALYEKWDVRLSAANPEQLGARVDRYQELLMTGGEIRRVLGIPGSDVRYHPGRDQILADLAIDISLPYMEEIRMRDWRRLQFYREAITAER